MVKVYQPAAVIHPAARIGAWVAGVGVGILG